MRFLWDSFRWRFVAAWYWVRWMVQGFPMKGMPAPTIWQNTKWAWRSWRAVIMQKHETYVPLSDLWKN